MKRVLALVLMMVLLSASAIAERIDLDNMSLSDLLKLHERLDAMIQEKFDCDLVGNGIYQGVYVVGEDIKAGRYLLTSMSKTYFMCHLYEDANHKAAHNGGQHETLLSVGDTISIKFEDGMVFVVDQGIASIKAIEDPEWAP